MRNILKATTIENKLPLLAVEQGCIVSKDADLTVCFEVSLPELYTVTAQEYEALHAAWCKAIRVLPIFDLIASVGVISDHDMFNTFNMGVGMTVIVSRKDAPTALNVLRENGEDAYVIGVIARGSEKLVIE